MSIGSGTVLIIISSYFLDLAFIEFSNGKFPPSNIFGSQILNSILLAQAQIQP